MKNRIWMALGWLLLSITVSPTAKAEDVLDTVVDIRILESGDNQIHGFTYFNGYLWASTRTNPCRILKIDPETLDYERIILDPGLNDGEDLIAAGGYIWVILWTSPSRIVRVNPETLEWEVAISFRQNELFQGGSLEYAYGYLWAGGRDGKIARINIDNLSYQVYDYSAATGNFQFHAMTGGGGYIWGSAPAYRDSWFWGRTYIGNTIVRVNPEDPTVYSSVYIDSYHFSDDIAYADGYLYAGSEEAPSYTYRIADDLSYTRARAGDTICYGIFVRDDGIWGAYVGSPGRIARFDLDLNLEVAYQLPLGYRDANEIAFDPHGNLYYVTCWESPAKIVKLERRELRYFVSNPADADRGGVIIPIEAFPEGEGNLIPIYVPPVTNGSNQVREDNGWRTVKEIRRSKLSFEWEKLVVGFSPEGADVPAGAGLSAASGLIKALHGAFSVYECRITVQKDPDDNFRAILQLGDPEGRTFVRMHAGETWSPFADSFWLIQAVLSEQIAETFRLDPDDFPHAYYTMSLDIDPAHEDNPYVGYLSLSQDDRIVITPRVYPEDRLRILRVHQIIVPYKIETVIELAGDGFASFMEGPADPGLVKMLSSSESESAIVVQGRSPMELRVYDSQARITGVVNGEVKEEIPASVYDQQHSVVLILSPADVYRYEVKGRDKGEYGLDVNFVRGEEAAAFTASRILTSAGAVHRYTIDWDALSVGGEGVSVQMDDDGDGAFERLVFSDSQFTQDEYLTVTSVTPDGKYPTTWARLKRTALLQNYPNPFNPDTWIPYILADETQVSVRIYAVSGRLIKALHLGEKPAGVYFSKEKAAYWDGSDDAGEPVASGVYFYTLHAGSFRATRKMIVTR